MELLYRFSVGLALSKMSTFIQSLSVKMQGFNFLKKLKLKRGFRLGDAFWKEDTFLPYMFRLMTSFAVIYHVKYLPPMRRKKSETAESFARRLQQRIAEANESDALPLDMGVLKKKSEQKKLFDHSQYQCAKILSLKNQI